MQHAARHLRRLRHTLDLARVAFSQTSFWRESFLNISNHLPDSSFALLTIVSFDLFRQYPGYQILSSFNWFGRKNEQFSQFAPRFQRDQTCFGIFDVSDIELLKIYIYI